ncbi:hypothetical protein A2U01_0110992, partial [Trifolium medium]|nr:hypothetical protein [Trifolium medium]
HGSNTTCWESGELGRNNWVNAPRPQERETSHLHPKP